MKKKITNLLEASEEGLTAVGVKKIWFDTSDIGEQYFYVQVENEQWEMVDLPSGRVHYLRLDPNVKKVVGAALIEYEHYLIENNVGMLIEASYSVPRTAKMVFPRTKSS